MPDADVLVVGGGPAGLAAATELARCGRRVIVLEREPEAGGIPRHCGHYPFGMREFNRLLRGPDYAARLRQEAVSAGVTIRTRTTVTALLPGSNVEITDNGGPGTLAAKAVMLATGVRETSRAARLISGDKPGGVLSTGALQGMVYMNHQRPFQRPVILGTELVAFSALLTCHHAGIRPLAMIEPGVRPTVRAPAQWLALLQRVPIHLNSHLVAIHGRVQVEGVTLSTPNGSLELSADGVIVSGGFRPEAALLRGSHIEVDPASGGPVIDRWGRLSDPTYFAAGNLLRGVESAGWCWTEGKRTALAIHSALNGELPKQDGARIYIGHPALRLVVPQIVGPASAQLSYSLPHNHLQIRLAEAAKGYLRLIQGGRTVASARLDSLPERRLSLPLPTLSGTEPLSLTIEDRP